MLGASGKVVLNPPGERPLATGERLIAIAADDAHLEAAAPSQISETIELAGVFAELFSAGGSEIYLRPAEEFILAGLETDYATVVEAVRRRGETAIGFRLAAAADDPGRCFGVRINPAKSERVTLDRGGRIIVLANL